MDYEQLYYDVLHENKKLKNIIEQQEYIISELKKDKDKKLKFYLLSEIFKYKTKEELNGINSRNK